MTISSQESNAHNSIGARYISVLRDVQQPVEAVQSTPNNVRLIAVSKTKPMIDILSAYQAGARLFGENYVQEVVAKQSELAEHYPALLHQDSAIEWHFIGHLQSNKVRMIAPFVAWIHSVDSVKLGMEIAKQAQKHNRIINVLIQVNTSGEASKSGCAPDEAEQIIHALLGQAGIALRGLMTIPEAVETPESARPAFHLLRKVRDSIATKFALQNFTELSMGMSHDFGVAIEEGATMIRIGTAIFGERNYQA
jgi:PLP dependent protein